MTLCWYIKLLYLCSVAYTCFVSLFIYAVKYFNYWFEFLQEIDHVSYVRQAFEAGSLSHLVEILQSNVLKDSDVSYLN